MTGWETLNNVLASDRFWSIIIVLMLLIVILFIGVKLNVIDIDTKHVRLGLNDSDNERRIVREQLDWVACYLDGLEGKIRQMIPEDGQMLYGGYFTKYILNLVYKEVSKWVSFNHIEDTEAYISTKAMKIQSLVYAQHVQPQFMTTEFKERMSRWVSEVIKELIKIRKLYSK